MAVNGQIHFNGQDLILLAHTTISTAVTAVNTPAVKILSGMKYLAVQAIFLYGSGGTTANVYVQTTLDGGGTWFDIMNFSFTTSAATKMSAVNAYIAPATQANAPTNGSLTANTIVQGTLGSQLRVQYTTTGTYAGATSLQVNGVVKG